MRKTLLSLVLNFAVVMAGASASLTSTVQAGFFWMTCEAWMDTEVFGPTDRLLYMSGVRDGLIFNKMEIQGVRFPDLSVDAAIRGVNQVCEDYANARIPVPFIMKVVALRMAGSDENVVEAELRRFRQDFTE
jgi:hypothetical protein